MKFDMHKKNGKDNYMKMAWGKKMVGHSKVKLWTLFGGQGEHGWTLQVYTYVCYMCIYVISMYVHILV